MPNSIIPFITFCGQTKEALQFYLETFPNSSIESITYITKDDRGVEGDVLNASFTLCNTPFMAMDMEKQYCPDPSWQTSFYLELDTEEEFDQLFIALSKEGNVLMGPEPITTDSISLRKCAWVTDKYQITWQIIFI